MNRITVSLLAALDAVIAVGIGVAIPLVPLTVMWGVQFDLAGDWMSFWRAACDVWLLGNGVDLTFTLDPATAVGFGLSGQTVFTVTIAALGFALLTAVLGSRTGRRAWATEHAITASITGVVVFAVLSTLVTLSAHTGPVIPSLLQGALLPAGVFALGILIGLAAAETRDRADIGRRAGLGATAPIGSAPFGTGHSGTGRIGTGHPGSTREPAARASLPWPVDRWSPSTRAVLAASLRGGVAASLLMVAVSAVLLTLLMALRYGSIVGLYEALQPGVLGALGLTLAQLAFLPNAIIWTASWLAGPGFALGTGSSIDPTQTLVGPLPNVPLLGALPQGDPAFGLIGVLAPVLCGVAAGVLTRQRLNRMAGLGALRAPRSDDWTAGRLALVVLGTAVVSGAIVGLLAWWSAGAIGPGRLQHVGPNGLLVAGAVAVEILVGTAIGIAVRRQSDEDDAPVALRERREMASRRP
ncbi:MAG: cell division protein PerM [Humibacter sp.]